MDASTRSLSPELMALLHRVLEEVEKETGWTLKQPRSRLEIVRQEGGAGLTIYGHGRMVGVARPR